MKLKALSPNLIVKDVNKTVAFYREAFGFKTIVTNPESGVLEFALMQLDNVSLMFQSFGSYADALPQFKDQKIGASMMLYIDVENLDIVYKKAKAAGAEIFVDLNTTFYGTREFTIKDIDGYLLIFAEDQPGEPKI